MAPKAGNCAPKARAAAQHVYAGFDAVLLAQPATPAQALLVKSAWTAR
jgi:hypothetical protein